MRQLLQSVVVGAYRALFPGAPGNSLHLMLLLVERDRPPELVSEPRARSVMVLAPHMDDEVLGCGGTLAKLVRSGAEALVVYLTDGSRGDASLNAARLGAGERRRAEAALSEVRRRESVSATEALGIKNRVFLEFPDGRLRPTVEVVRRVRDLLAKHQPDQVYLPFVLDLHEDHRQTNAIFHEAALGLPAGWRDRLLCVGYEVWSPLPANRVVDVSDVMDRKLEAVGAFRSQLAQVDYARCVEGLNAYRSLVMMRGRGYAEAFHACSFAGYSELYQRLADRTPAP